MLLDFLIVQNKTTSPQKGKPQLWSLHYISSNIICWEINFVFFVDHMVLIYLVNKPQVSKRITRWLLLFLEYDFIIIYKLGKTHVVADALSRLPNTTKPTGIPKQYTYASFFFIDSKWLNDVKLFKNRIDGKFFIYKTKAKINQEG